MTDVRFSWIVTGHENVVRQATTSLYIISMKASVESCHAAPHECRQHQGFCPCESAAPLRPLGHHSMKTCPLHRVHNEHQDQSTLLLCLTVLLADYCCLFMCSSSPPNSFMRCFWNLAIAFSSAVRLSSSSPKRLSTNALALRSCRYSTNRVFLRCIKQLP